MFSQKTKYRLRQTQTPTLAVLVLPFKHLFLALHLTQVQQVLRMPEVYKGGQTSLGLAHFKEREAIVLDLHEKIYHCPNPEPERYLVVLATGDDRLFALPVVALPALVNLPTTELRPLPPDYREQDTLGIASHLATLTKGEQTQTIFLLDPERLFPARSSPFRVDGVWSPSFSLESSVRMETDY